MPLLPRRHPGFRLLSLALLLGGGHGLAGGSLPSWRQLQESGWEARLLPGHREFVFTLYGTPGELAPLRELVEVMRREGLGNGFDPGPAARAGSKALFDYLATVGWPVVAYPGCADMQIQGGRCVLNDEDAAALEGRDRAGLFTAVQLGEWGYYFHNLAPNEAWWRDVYGPDFESMRRLMKPAGLAGYETRPGAKRDCYAILRDYFQSRNRDLLQRVISVTGHSHYEAYAAEWGTRCVGLELGENIAFTQSKLAFARGASRQWGLPWSVQVSPWFHGSCTTAGPLRREGRYARGLDAGHSLSFYERLWLHAWFAGAAMVTPENSLAIFFEPGDPPWRLTEHGRRAAEVFRFCRTHDRGIPWTPVAIVLDQYAGYNGYMGRPWGILEPTEGDREIVDLLENRLFPGSDHIHRPADPANPEASYLRPTPLGEVFDVLLSSVGPGLLGRYPVILLVGDHEFGAEFVNRLTEAVAGGSRLLMTGRQREALGEAFGRLARAGAVEVLPGLSESGTSGTDRPLLHRLDELVREWMPVVVTGDAVQFQVNRLATGWVVELVNNRGVAKRPDEPASVDPLAVAKVVLRAKAPFRRAKEWRSGREHTQTDEVTLSLGPGRSEFVELVDR